MEGSKKKLKTVEQPEVQTSPCPWRQPWKKRKFDSLSESIRFPKKRNVRFDCTGCWRLSAKPPIDGLPQLTRQLRSRHDTRAHVITHHWSVSSVTAQTRSGILTSLFSRPYQQSRLCYSVASVCRLSVMLCIVAKRCIIQQKLLYWQPIESRMRNRLVPKWMTLTFV